VSEEADMVEEGIWTWKELEVELAEELEEELEEEPEEELEG